MKKKAITIISVILAFVAGCVLLPPLSAAAQQGVTRTQITNAYGQTAYSYTVQADGNHRYTASDKGGGVRATGNCVVLSHRTSRGAVVIDGVGCTGVGTATFTTSNRTCGATELLSEDGGVFYADQHEPDCTTGYTVETRVGDGFVEWFNQYPTTAKSVSLYAFTGVSAPHAFVVSGQGSAVVTAATCWGGRFGSTAYACWLVSATVSPLGTLRVSA